MVYNLYKTAASGKFVANEETSAPALEKNAVVHKGHWHRWIERRPVQMLIVSLVMILIGGMIEIIPMLTVKSNIPTIASVKPFPSPPSPRVRLPGMAISCPRRWPGEARARS